MTSDLKTTIIGVAIIALIGFGFWAEVDKDILFALIGIIAGGGFLLTKDAGKS